MTRSISKVLMALVPWLILAAPASAATLITPLVATNGSQEPGCLITNVGTKPITVTAELVAGSGFTVTPVAANCPEPPATLAPRVTCQAVAPLGFDVYCIVEASGKVRAGITVFESGGIFGGFVPATK
jgi:hypothetical protein